jgi:hypothetical protein
MSWLGDVVDRARGATEKAGVGASQVLPKQWRGGGQTAFRYGVASMGGGMGLQYEYSRNKGMNSSEALNNAGTGGYNYQAVRGEQQQRQALESAQILLANQQKAANDQSLVDQNAAAYRAARRKQLAAANASSNATTLTGPSGLGDSSGGTAKTLLGA